MYQNQVKIDWSRTLSLDEIPYHESKKHHFYMIFTVRLDFEIGTKSFDLQYIGSTNNILSKMIKPCHNLALKSLILQNQRIVFKLGKLITLKQGKISYPTLIKYTGYSLIKQAEPTFNMSNLEPVTFDEEELLIENIGDFLPLKKTINTSDKKSLYKAKVYI